MIKLRVSPACAGMILRDGMLQITSRCEPRMRGDDPISLEVFGHSFL